MPRTTNLGLHFQEPLTAVVMLRAMRANREPVSDADSFRSQMIELLRIAATDARNDGYSVEEVKQATFACVALLDETILNSRNPVFDRWVSKPLQADMFGTFVAGETFFQIVQRLLVREDSPDVADVLELYFLCLLLGYRGRYSLSGGGELQATIDPIGAKLRRIRGGYCGLAANWRLPNEVPPPPTPSRGLLIWKWIGIGCAVLAVFLFVLFKINLNAGVNELLTLASQARP